MSGNKGKQPDALSVQRKKKSGPHPKSKNTARKKPLLLSGRVSGCFPLEQSQQIKTGSLTIEAALILPLFWAFVAGFLYLLLFFRLQEEIGQGLADAGRKLGVYAYAGETEISGLALLQAWQEVTEHCKDQAANSLIEGGIVGISLEKSKVMEEDSMIELIASYEILLPWRLLGMDSIPVLQRQACRAWTGGGGSDQMSELDEIVYVTPSGTVYHRSLECKHLALSIQTAYLEQAESKRNKNGERYRACERCWKGTSGVIYITDYGNRYHQNLNCSGLKRTVYLVFLSEVSGRGACKSCAA